MQKKSYTSSSEISLIISGEHSNPSQIIGQHKINIEGKEAIIIRGFFSFARDVWIIHNSEKVTKMKKVHKEGFYEAAFPECNEYFPYHFRIKDYDEKYYEFKDPYSFPPILTDYDLYLLTEGTHNQSYEKMGAHYVEIEGIYGVHFAVWAPNAKRVSILCDFNRWDGRVHPMNNRGTSGIWELFIPDLKEGETYKYEIKSQYDNQIYIKSDPYAFYSEKPPKSASIVHNIDKYEWNDQQWMENRKTTNWLEKPISIYEVHLGSWMRVPEEGNRYLTYRELSEKLIPYVKQMGYTHIELLPVTEHPLDESWGYQTIAYYAPTSRHGKPEDFMFFLDKCHQEGIGVIMDWVPSHFPKDAHGLAFFDGTHLYEHADPRKGEQKDWGTLIFNYGRNEVSNFLLSNALFWLKKYHIDGLRVDAVASMLYLDYSRKPDEWIPNDYGGNENISAIQFIKKFNEVVYLNYPGVLTIAEESTAWPMVSRPTYLGGLGFSLKWNMGWMHDSIEYINKDPIHRKFHHNNLTFSLLYAFSENFILVLSHDEVVHGKKSLIDKMPGDYNQKFANLRLFYGFMFGHPGKKLLFMSGEFGQWIEWRVNHSLDWNLLEYESHRKLQHYVKDLNLIYQSEPSLYELDFEHTGFEWIDFRDVNHSIISFIRKAKNQRDFLILVFNFTPVPRFGYRIGVPKHHFYKEILNSDSEVYGGNNFGNKGGIMAEAIPWHGKPFSLNLILPPLSVLIFKPIIP
jgi:1,4-alpha-glucan branching enzyme